MEVRHRSWEHREVQDFLTMIGLDFCNIDQPQVSYSLGKTVWATGPVGYLRAHGRRRKKWFEFGDDREARYDYLYAPEELQDLASRTRELLEKTPEVYVIFNNHPRGQAVANALEMAHLLTGRCLSPATRPDCRVSPLGGVGTQIVSGRGATGFPQAGKPVPPTSGALRLKPLPQPLKIS